MTYQLFSSNCAILSKLARVHCMLLEARTHGPICSRPWFGSFTCISMRTTWQKLWDLSAIHSHACVLTFLDETLQGNARGHDSNFLEHTRRAYAVCHDNYPYVLRVLRQNNCQYFLAGDDKASVALEREFVSAQTEKSRYLAKNIQDLELVRSVPYTRCVLAISIDRYQTGKLRFESCTREHGSEK